MTVLETDRLVLSRLDRDDAAFILELVNEPAWLRHIGDKGVRTLDDARGYIENGPVEMYGRLGFGLYLVALKGTGVPIGICGLIKREALADVDLGFAFLARSWGHGYAFEAAAAVVAYGTRTLGPGRVLAVTAQENHASMKLLDKLGFRFERLVRLAADGPEVRLYACGAVGRDG
jgi:RimJ/RimL family protein N-acetyltransferase